MADSTMKSMADILASHPIFAGLDKQITDLLGGCARNLHFPDAAYLCKEGGAADVFYLLRAGDVAIELGMPGRGRLTVETAHPGDLVGVSWMLPPYHWRFDMRAVGDVRVTSVDAACLRNKCDAEPAMGYQVMQRFLPVIAERLESTRIRLLDLYAPPTEVGRAS